MFGSLVVAGSADINTGGGVNCTFSAFDFDPLDIDLW